MIGNVLKVESRTLRESGIDRVILKQQNQMLYPLEWNTMDTYHTEYFPQTV